DLAYSINSVFGEELFATNLPNVQAWYLASRSLADVIMFNLDKLTSAEEIRNNVLDKVESMRKHGQSINKLSNSIRNTKTLVKVVDKYSERLDLFKTRLHQLALDAVIEVLASNSILNSGK